MSRNGRSPATRRPVRSVKPGDRVLRVRSRRSRLPLVERRLGRRVAGVFEFLADTGTQQPVLWMIAVLAILVGLGPIPVSE